MDHHRRCSRPVGKKMKTIHKKVNAQAQEPRSSSPDLPIPAEDLQESESEDYGESESDTLCTFDMNKSNGGKQ